MHRINCPWYRGTHGEDYVTIFAQWKKNNVAKVEHGHSL